MKKKAMSLLLALALCLSLLPTAALAEDTQAAAQPVLAEQEPPAGEQETLPLPEETKTPAEETPEVPETETVTESEPDAAVLSVQAQIDALPGADELEDMDADELDAAYMAVQAAYDAYEALTEDQRAELTGAECFEALFGWFNKQVAPLAEATVHPDVIDENGNITTGTSSSFSLNGPVLTADDMTLGDSQYYIVQNNVIIDGDLTISSNGGGLVIRQGKKLTVKGSLIFNGNSGFGIFGESINNGASVGKLVIENSKGAGAAIRTTSTSGSAPQLRVCSGELTINGGNSNKIVDGVELYSENKIHKGTLDGNAKLPSEWGKSSITGKKLVLEYCDHPDEYYGGVDNGDGTTHHGKCNLCGFEWKTEGAKYFKEEHSFKYELINATQHKATCVLCGYEKTEVHQIGGGLDGKKVPTLDGKGHTDGACECGFSDGEVAEHSYNEYGACKDCDFEPILQGKNGNLYDDFKTAIKNGETELTLVSKATGTVADIVRTNIELDTDANITLNMGDYTLAGDGNPTLAVSAGKLTVKGAATIANTGKNEMLASAVKVTGGELIFENNVTATGGASSDKVASAIEVSGGKLTFQGEVNATSQDITEIQTYGATLAPAIKVTDGTVTFKDVIAKGSYYVGGGSFNASQAPAIQATGGKLDFQGSLTLNGSLELANADILVNKLTKGIFTANANVQNANRVSLINAKSCNTLLENGYAFYEYMEGQEATNLVNAFPASLCKDVTIAEHTHDYKTVGGQTYRVCDCGKTCAHTDGFTNGVCNTEGCDYACSHSSVTNDTSTGETIWKCETCHMPMTVRIENGGNTTYSTDFASAMNNAADGTTITLLADIDNSGKTACITGDNTTVTLELNGHTIREGWIHVGWGENWGEQITSSTLKITGNGSFTLSGIYGHISVGAKATLDLSGWMSGKITRVEISKQDDNEGVLVVSEDMKGTIGSLGFLNWPTAGIKTKLNGGSYDEIKITLHYNSEPYSSMLAPGYAFQYIDENGEPTEEFVEYTKTATNQGNMIEHVKVVKCLHPNMEPDENGVATCDYCGTSGTFVASVNGNTYKTDEWDKAFTDWAENAGILKLYTDYTASGDVTWYGGYGTNVLDLNGYTMTAENGAFKPSDKLVAGMSLTVQDTSEGQNGSISHIILADENNYRSLTLESGHIGNLEVVDYHPSGVALNGGSIGRYSLPGNRVLADIIDTGTYFDGGDLAAKSKTTADKITIQGEVPILYNTGGSVSGEISFGGNVPFSPLVYPNGHTEADSYLVKWYRRTNDGVQLMETVERDASGNETGTKTQDPKAFEGLKAGDELKVFCVIEAQKESSTLWQMAITGTFMDEYTLTVAHTNLGGEDTNVEITNADSLVYTGQALTPTVKVTYNGIELKEGTDYTISGNTGTDAKEYTLTITGKGNYTGTKTADWTILPHKIGAPETTEDELFAALTKVYDGTTDLPKTFTLSKFKSLTETSKTVTLAQGEDFTVSGRYTYAAATGQSVTVDIALKEGGNYTFTTGLTASLETPGKIIKATAPDTTEESVTVTNNRAYTYTVDLAALLPALTSPMQYGEVTYTLGTVSINGGYYDAEQGKAVIKDGKLLLPIKAVPSETEQNIGTVTVTVSSENIENFDLTITAKAVNKIVPTGAPKLSKDTLAWGETLDTITLSGSMADPTDSTKTVAGKFEWVTPDAAMEKVGEYEAAWKFAPTEDAFYAEVTGTMKLTVTKATPKGTPGYTKITTGGKTLADAKLTIGTIQPEGTIRWELADTTVAAANTAYKWVFTPKDSEHYKELTGNITPYSVSSSGSSGGSGSSDRDDSRGVVKVETKTNPDGSVTRTETLSNGTVTSTTTYPDGSTTKTTTKADGSSVTERREANGSTGTVTTDENGKTEVVVKVSEKAVSDAKKSGEAVKLPVSVKSGKNSNTAPTVRIEMPKNAGETKVELPVENVNSGTVAVLVHEDGTEELLKTGSTTKDGLQFTVNGTVTVKIIDNSKDFSDTRNHWAKDDVSFVTARGLFNGVSDSVFGVDRPMTRGMVNTVLARLAGVDTTPAAGQGAYDIGIAWAKANGVSDGTNPNASVTREQLAAMLYRFSGSPEVSGSLRFSDADTVSPYAKNALIWATQSGIINGVSSERIDPAAQAKRAQVAAMMARYLKNLETN